jgi:DNA N-6-adenine-methyltransferase (Dam)
VGLSSHQNTIGKNQEWLTPRWILKPLGKFDLDPCASVLRKYWVRAKTHWNIYDDGLSKIWFGRVWMNPPFHRYQVGKWLEKMAQHNNGIALIPARTETENFYKYVWDIADGILFIKTRPHFCYPDGTEAKFNSGAPICLIAYGKSNLDILIKSGLGVVVKKI